VTSKVLEALEAEAKAALSRVVPARGADDARQRQPVRREPLGAKRHQQEQDRRDRAAGCALKERQAEQLAELQVARQEQQERNIELLKLLREE
jgi:hypothetical protein